MAQARINGQNVDVTKKDVTSPVSDVIYTISGEGAAALHATLKDVNVTLSDIANGSFAVTKSALRDPFMDMPFTKSLESKLAAVASTLEVK